MPRAQERSFTSGSDTAITPTVRGMTGTTPTTRKRRRFRAATAANSVAGSARGKQYLSLDRTDANHVIAKDLTAGELATFVNTICAVEEKQPGIVAKDPLWAYNLGVQMFGV